MNPYAYARQNPLRWVDALGLDATLLTVDDPRFRDLIGVPGAAQDFANQARGRAAEIKADIAAVKMAQAAGDLYGAVGDFEEAWDALIEGNWLSAFLKGRDAAEGGADASQDIYDNLPISIAPLNGGPSPTQPPTICQPSTPH